MSRNKKRSFLSYITTNFGLKVLSLLFAVILWAFVISETNQDRTKRFESITVVVSGTESLAERGLTTREDLSASPLTVTVKVNVARSDYQYFDKSYVNAEVDLSEITSEGSATVPVHITLGNANASLASVSPSALGVTIDRIEEKSVPLSVEKTGKLSAGLVSLEPSYPETVDISGASYYVDKITNAVVDVDLSSLSDGDVLSSTCRFTDEKGNAIKFGSVRASIDMDVQTIKEVPINTADAEINADNLAEGYTFEAVSAGKVKVCGHKAAIGKLTEITVKTIDLTGKDSSCTSIPLELSLPEGISLLPGQSTPTATVKIAESISDITFNCPITVAGLVDGSTATLTVGSTTKKIKADGSSGLTASVTLSGSAVALKSVTESDLIVRLSLTDKAPGVYELTPVISLSTAIASGITAQLNSPTVVSVSIK